MVPFKLKDFFGEGMFQQLQTARLECPLCGHNITGSDLEPDASVNLKLFGAAGWTVCPHCGQPTGGGEHDIEWKVKVTTYLFKNRREEFNRLDPEWKKQWLHILFLTDRKTFRQIAKKR